MEINNKIICITPVKHIEKVYSNLSIYGNFIYEPEINKEDLKSLLIKDREIVAIFTNPNKQIFKIDEYLLDGSNIKVISTASTGTNHIDMEYCKNRKIEVLSLTKDYDVIKKISSTAELSFSLMLSLIRNIPRSVNDVMNFNWDYEKHIGRQLNSLTVGIVGYGRLGEIFAKFCDPFFKDVIISDPYKQTGKYKNFDLNGLLSKSDVVALHVHLNEETYHMINDNTISVMKNGCYLINTSRGDIVDEDAVLRGISSGKIKGYATDVLSNELTGHIEDSPIIQSMIHGMNVIVTPHIGGMTKEAQEIAYQHSVKKLFSFMHLLK